MPQIEVTFDIDADGIVNVSARDQATGKEQAIRIQASGGLAEREIERMVKEAHAAENRRPRQLIDARKEADARIYSVEKNLPGARRQASCRRSRGHRAAVRGAQRGHGPRGCRGDPRRDRRAEPGRDEARPGDVRRAGRRATRAERRRRTG